MSYATLLTKEGINSQFLAVIKPRRQVSSWTLVSGTKYTSSFSFGEIIILTKGGVVQTQASSSSLSDGVWFYDPSTELLTVDFSVNPSTLFVVATYEIYLGTFDSHWYRVPNDNATRVVYYEPLIVKSPIVQQSASDVLYGLLPSQQSQMVISNATQLYQSHLYASSFAECDIDIWHYLDELSEQNVTLLFRGICGNLTISDKEMSLSVYDRNKIFENEYRHSTLLSFFATSDFPNLDQNFHGRPIKNVFGVVNGMIPVNVDFDSVGSTSTNRNWVCVAGDTNLGSVSTTVPAAPASTTTRTYLNSVVGFRVGDSVWIDSASGGAFDEFPLVTAVGVNYIDHAAITNIAATNSVVKRSFVAFVDIFKEGKAYKARYGRDYQEYVNATKEVAGFSFTTTMEANLSLPSPLVPSDLVHCRVYGHKNTNTLGGNPFGSDDSALGCLSQGIVILYEIMKSRMGLAETELNTTAFTSLQGSVTDGLGFQVPFTATSDFPSYRDLIGQIAATLLLKIYLDNDNKWSFSRLGPIVSTTKTIADDEILLASWLYNINYDDVYSKILVEYAQREVSEKNQVSQDSFSRVSASSETALYLHNIKRQKSFESLHYSETDAQTLANRLSFIFGERSGLVSFETKNRFFDSLLGDKITVQRSRLLGFTYDADTEQTRDFEVTNTSKSLNLITVGMNDQKGIQDNQGSW